VLSGHSPGGLGCRLDPASTVPAPGTLSASLTRELAVQGTPNGRVLSVTAPSAQAAWAVGSWAVAHADADGITTVTVGDRTWTRDRDKESWSWHASGSGGPATRVVITLR